MGKATGVVYPKFEGDKVFLYEGYEGIWVFSSKDGIFSRIDKEKDENEILVEVGEEMINIEEKIVFKGMGDPMLSLTELYRKYGEDPVAASEKLQELTITDPTVRAVRALFDAHEGAGVFSTPQRLAKNYSIFLIISLILTKQDLAAKTTELAGKQPIKASILQEMFLLTLNKISEWKEVLEDEKQDDDVKVRFMFAQLSEFSEVLSDMLVRKGLLTEE